MEYAHNDPNEVIELVIGNMPTPIPVFRPAIYATALRAHTITINRHWAHPSWEVLIRTPLPFTRHLQLIDVHRGGNQHLVIGARTDFDNPFPSLTNLRITNLSLPWSTLTLPSGLIVLDIDIHDLVPAHSVQSPPELEPCHSIPSLAQLRNILLPCTALLHLSLYGIFSSAPSIVFSPPGPIHLPSLKYLSLGGNGAPIDALIRSLSVPSLTKVYIASSTWSAIRAVPLLTSQMGLSSLHPPKLAIIDAGPPYSLTRPSIFFTIMCKPSPVIITLECIDTTTDQWFHMVTCCGVQGIERLAVRDRSATYPFIRPPSPLPWYNITSTIVNVKEVQLLDGSRWADALSAVVFRQEQHMWPLLRVIDFKVEDGVDREDVVCMSRWLMRIRESGREVIVNIRGDRVNGTNIQPLLLGLPDFALSAFRDWLSGDGS